MGNIKINASGQVSIYLINSAKKQLILTRSNNIMPLALDVIARLMGNYPVGKIDTINIYNAGLLLASTPIITYMHPDINQVQYTAIFDEASFSGSYDKLELVASAMGEIAELTNLVGNKSDTEQLSVTWTVTISN